MTRRHLGEKRKKGKRVFASCETCTSSHWSLADNDYLCKIWQKSFCEKFNYYYYTADKHKKQFYQKLDTSNMEKGEFITEKEMEL